jgi:Farnesoic acid 0-methyl transferase
MQPQTQQFVFGVQACRSAHIGFSVSEFNHIAYEIVLGDENNERSVIRDSRSWVITAAVAETPGILHCYLFRR